MPVDVCCVLSEGFQGQAVLISLQSFHQNTHTHTQDAHTPGFLM